MSTQPLSIDTSMPTTTSPTSASERVDLEPSSVTSDQSPLDSLAPALESALPDIGSSASQQQQNQDQQHSLTINGDVPPQRRESLDDTEDAVRQYRAGLHMYTQARFNGFRREMEGRAARNASPAIVGRKSPGKN